MSRNVFVCLSPVQKFLPNRLYLSLDGDGKNLLLYRVLQNSRPFNFIPPEFKVCVKIWQTLFILRNAFSDYKIKRTKQAIASRRVFLKHQYLWVYTYRIIWCPAPIHGRYLFENHHYISAFFFQFVTYSSFGSIALRNDELF